jgi:hypothetical protein
MLACMVSSECGRPRMLALLLLLLLVLEVVVVLLEVLEVKADDGAHADTL